MWIHWPFFPKTWTKGHWPLDDLWPHVCWGHMCDSTQGSLCPSPMTIHQCMWIQWSILQNTTYIHIHTYIHTTYYVQNEWSHSLLLNSVQARQKVGICIPSKVLAWAMTACRVLCSRLIYFWRNMNIPSIFYFSTLSSTSINTQYSSLWDTLKMMLFTKYLIKWKRIGRISWKFW